MCSHEIFNFFPVKIIASVFLQENNNLITVTVMISPTVMKVGKHLKGRTGLAREFKINKININKT